MGWSDFTAVIVASGPSLSDEQCALIGERRAANACRVIVVNNNYRKVPTADILYACDHRWWKCHIGDLAVDMKPGIRAVCPTMQRWSVEARAAKDFGCKVLHVQGGNGIAPPGVDFVQRGTGGGYQAFGLAIKLGSKHIVLVGMDCKRGPRGESHHHGDHPIRELPNPQPFEGWAVEWDTVVKPCGLRGIDVVNCSLDTAIRKIRRSTLEIELSGEKRLYATG